MKKFKLSILTILFAPMLMSLDVPSEYLDEIKKVKANFDRDQLSLDINYAVYSRTGNILLETKNGSCELTGDNYQYNLGSISIIQNDSWLVYMDKSDQLVVVKEKEPIEPAGLMSFEMSTEGIETLTRKQKGNVLVYSMTFKSPVSKLYDGIEIFCSKSDFKPLKIAIDYAYQTEYVKKDGVLINDKLRFEISYRNVSYRAKQDYSTEHIFQKEGEGLSLTEAYASYRLLDQRVEYRIQQN